MNSVDEKIMDSQKPSSNFLYGTTGTIHLEEKAGKEIFKMKDVSIVLLDTLSLSINLRFQ